jgi:hypothetical protein
LRQRVGGRLGLAVAGEDTFLFPPTRMDSGGGGEVGEVPHVLADDGLDAVEPDGSCPGIRPGIPRSRASGYDRRRSAAVHPIEPILIGIAAVTRRSLLIVVS